MRILMLCHEFPPLGGGGGRVCADVSQALVAAGHAVWVLTTNHRNLPKRENTNGIDVHRVYGKRKNDLHNNVPITMTSFLLLGTRRARQMQKEHHFDVIHAFFTLPAGLSGVRLKRKTGLPLVVSPHGSDVPHHNPEKHNVPIRLLSPLISHIWKNADRVVTVSDGLRQTARRTAPDVAIDVIHNGVDIQHFTPPETPPQNPVPQIISVGRLVELKGLHHLLEAAAQLRQKEWAFHLKIAGEGPERARLETLIHQFKLTKRVTLLGHVPYQKLPELYRQSDLFVLPSLAESFGQVFAEAMASGLPVIGTRAGGIPEAVGPQQRDWLIAPGDVPELAQKIQALLSDGPMRQTLGKQNVDSVRQRLSWARIAGQYADLYAELIT